ncbi:acylating sulfoacetaldehyde dehydrogenase [Pseudothauera rhizosphaerae]|uniref:Aldehyde dehydrogenase family protein n=1 Tax=Pseudothauera rhizosphaerae TaxID=2565932 RepID=A0A4S4B0P9_9RHOO|nr:aldehyde dehydrogenase family protein [Pseudothauera rhizosphaerae]THF65214.1 aldehyde dehydrogenase family protein [Pseudothauera rhizosphaerae]
MAGGIVAGLLARARAAQALFADADQRRADTAAAAAAWAILEPARNRRLAELAVRDTGFGDVEDKVRKNHRKTLGLLRDLHGAASVGVLREDPALGLTEIARPVGVVAAVTPSTNPAATPANKVINALKGRNAIVLAPSPKGASTCALLVGYIRHELEKASLPADLVQHLPPPGSKEQVAELMAGADLVVATGSRANVRAAYASGTPALGVGAGNVAAIVLPGADPATTARRIAASKTFDNATSCSSENALVLVGEAAQPVLDALQEEGAVLLDAAQKARLQATLFPAGRLSAECVARPAAEIAARAGLEGEAFRNARILLVEEEGVGPDFPFSGEKLSPVLTLYQVADFAAARDLVGRIYDYQGKGHSVGIHGGSADEIRALAETLPVCRVIVDQVHCVAVGGAFDNGLPFSLSMGCGTWGGNGFSDNLNYRHFLNVTRIVRPIPERVPRVEDLLGEYWREHGK